MRRFRVSLPNHLPGPFRCADARGDEGELTEAPSCRARARALPTAASADRGAVEAGGDRRATSATEAGPETASAQEVPRP